jgi:putative DNA primase/helicase
MTNVEVMDRTATQFTAAKALSEATPLDEAELDRLALMPPIEYGQVRKPVADQLGIAVGYLDAAVTARKKELTPAANVGNGKPLEMPTIVPAEHPVDGAMLMQTLLEIMGKYVVLPDHAAVAIALWIMRAHCDDAFSISPRLAILSPVKRCGKTTVLELIAKLLPRPLPTSNVTASVIFRVIEKYHPSLLIDEADSFLKENEELRGIVNSGHRRDSASVLRNVGDDHEPRSFSTWSPMVIAAIGTLPDTIEDRSIVVSMRRKQPGETVQRLRWNSRHGETVKAHLQTVARALARWSFDHVHRLKDIDPAIPNGLHDRAADNWSPLLTIANAIGGPWIEQANAAAVALSTGETKTEPCGIEVLRDLEELFKTDARERFPSQGLCDALALLEERPWGDFRRGKPISSAQLARLLREFGIQSQSIRTEAGVQRGYYRDAFDDAFARYLATAPPSDCYTATTRFQSGENHLFEVLHTPPCSTLENPINPAPRAACSTVALQKPQTDLLGEVIHVD